MFLHSLWRNNCYCRETVCHDEQVQSLEERWMEDEERDQIVFQQSLRSLLGDLVRRQGRLNVSLGGPSFCSDIPSHPHPSYRKYVSYCLQ